MTDTLETTISSASNIALPDPVDHAPGLEALFSLNAQEDCYFVEDIEGEIPSFIRGNYYINGPAHFSRAGLKYRHWLDGDGMVCALRFDQEGIHFTNRYIRTAKFVAEEQAGRPIFRAFGTAFSGDRLHRGFALESPANVSVYSHQGVLLAFGEQALPWQLDPETLETIGQFDFRNAVTEFSPFAAHPKFDMKTGEMFNFGVFFSNKSPKLCLYRFGGDQQLKARSVRELEFPISLHDFGLSARYCIFYLAPYIMDVDQMTKGGNDMLTSLSWEPLRGSRLLVVARNRGEQLASIPVDPHYCLHTINCFEENGHLTVDVIELERPIYEQYQPLPNIFSDAPAGTPVRFVIDTRKWELVSRRELDYHLAADFPSINPEASGKSYRDFWMLGISKARQHGRKFFDQLVRANWEESKPEDIYQSAPQKYLGGEPLFVGDPESKAGALLCQEFDASAGQSAFLIFDADRVGRGPVAKLKLKRQIPLGFHASWNPQPVDH